jgi:AraC-like DNA-binding protein/quercetin dioxygenase-like cupin family protein
MQVPNKAEFELIPKNHLHSFAVREFALPRFQAPWHFHPECELTLILQSRGRRFVGDSFAEFAPGDLVLLGSNLPHYWRNPEAAVKTQSQSKAIVVQFREDCFGKDFLGLPEMTGIRKLLLRARRGLHFTGKTRDEVAVIMSRLPGLKSFDQLLDLLHIFKLLNESGEDRVLSSPGFSPLLDEFASERINRAYQFIFENFAAPIQHGQIARGSGMSLSAFGHYFKRATGRTLTDFINEVRVGHASRLLIETDQSVSEIAYASGFESLSHFNRRFRKLNGLNPKEYRCGHNSATRYLDQGRLGVPLFTSWR